MKWRKVVAVVISAVCVFALAGCSTSNQTGGGNTEEETVKTESGDSAAEIDWSKLPEGWNNPNIEQPARSGKEAPSKVADDGKITIGWCPPEMLPYYELVLKGVNEAIEEIGEDKIELVVQAPANQASGATEQLNIIENWVSQDFDAIIVSATDDGMLNAAFQKASEKGIAIIEFNMPQELIQNDYYVANCSPSGYDAGLAMGKWLVERHPDAKDVKVAIIEGIAGLHTNLRQEGFIKTLEENGGFEIVASQPADWNRDKAASVIENILTANPDIDVIYALYDDMALGTVSVIESKGMSGQIEVLGYDMTPEGLEAIKSGKMTASVYNGARQMGYDSVMAAYKYMAEGTMVPKLICGEPVVVDQESAASFTAFE